MSCIGDDFEPRTEFDPYVRVHNLQVECRMGGVEHPSLPAIDLWADLSDGSRAHLVIADHYPALGDLVHLLDDRVRESELATERDSKRQVPS